MAANVDISEIRQFFNNMGNATKSGFKKDMRLFLEATGFDFLRVVQDEIVRLKVMNTRRLLHSFEKGSDENIWEIEDDGLVLEVGSSTKYASFVNDGHWQNAKGVAQRFVPGYWTDREFVYDPNAKGGMLLRQKWVEGRPYFDSALRLYVKIFEKSADRVLQEWLDKYFNF